MYQTDPKRYAAPNLLVKKPTNGTIGPEDFGRLQANTNQILASQNLIALDRQQMESVEHGYRMRIQFLTGRMAQHVKLIPSNSAMGGGLLTRALASTVVVTTDKEALLHLALHWDEVRDDLPCNSRLLSGKT